MLHGVNFSSMQEGVMGRIAQTWELVGDSFAILKADRELLWLPIFSGVFCVLVSVVILGGGSLLSGPPIDSAGAHSLSRHSMSQGMWIWMFVFYLANYFVI